MKGLPTEIPKRNQLLLKTKIFNYGMFFFSCATKIAILYKGIKSTYIFCENVFFLSFQWKKNLKSWQASSKIRNCLQREEPHTVMSTALTITSEEVLGLSCCCIT